MVTLATIAATYVLTPFTIKALGQEGYGTWTVITSITGFVSLMALGVPMACVRYLAQDVATGDLKKINTTIGSCAGLYLAIGVVAVPIGGVLMVLYVAAGFFGLLPEGILFSHHDFVPRNLVRFSGVFLRLGLTVGLLALNASLVLLALVQIVCLVFDVSISWLLIRRRYPGVRISLADFDFGMIRRIFSFSLWVLVLSAGARLSFETDALVIGAFLGVGAIPFYVVANSLIVYLMEFVVAIAAVVAPMATKLNTEGRLDELREIFLKWSKGALSLTLVAGLFLIVLGPRFIGWWIDPSYERPSGEVLQILMASSFIFLPVRGVAQPILMGLGKPRIPAFAFLGAGLLNLLLSVLLVGPFGLTGVAIGTAIPNVLFAFVVLAVACRELNVAPASYVKYVVPRAALGGVPILALLLWCKFGLDVNTMAGLVASGSGMVLLWAITWVFFVYRQDPYVDVAQFLQARIWSRV